MAKPYFYTKSQLEKVGNAIIYLSSRIPDLNKTKLLKLLYLLEHLSIDRYGFPCFNIRFEVWQFGPVVKDIYIDLSSDSVNMLNPYINIDKCDNTTFIKPLKEFSDDEFSDNELQLLEYITKTFGNFSAKQLVKLTHNEHFPWYKTASQHGLIPHFESGQLNSTDIEVDFTYLFQDENKKEFYLENKELLSFSHNLKV